MSRDIARVVAAFGRSELFARLSPAERERFARRATLRKYSSGATIVREGDTSMTLYVLLSGSVGIDIAGQRVREQGPDSFFGEMGLIDDSPRSASVVALEPTECALLARWDVEHNGALALGLLPVLVQRLRGVKSLTEAELLQSLDTA